MRLAKAFLHQGKCDHVRILWAAIALLLTVPITAALPEQVHASVVGDEVAVMWARAGNVGSDVEDVVEWRDGNLTGSAEASEAYIAPGTTVFTAVVPWPESGHLAYRVGNDANGWSGEHGLELAPRDGTWRFVAYGDHGTGMESNRSILLVPQVQAERPHAILHLGDLSYANGHAPTWDDWFRLVEPLASRSLYMAAPGNHEHEGYYAASNPDPAWAFDTDAVQDAYHQFTTRFHFGADDLRYSFDVGPVHVTVINTEDLCAWQPAQYYVPWRVNPTCDQLEGDRDVNGQPVPGVEGTQAPPNQALIDWVRSDLQANQATWNIVMFHQPVYSAGAYSGRGVLRDHFVPLFQEFGVDLVLAGHDHNLQRSFPMRDHAPVSQNLTAYGIDEGPVYIVSGGAGDGYYDFRGEQPAWTAARNATYHYLVIDVRDDAIQVKAVEVPTGNVLDTFTIGTFEQETAPNPAPSDKGTPAVPAVLLVVVAMAIARRMR